VFSGRLEGFGRHAGEQTHPAAPDDPHRQDGSVLWANLSCILLVTLENFLEIAASRFRQYPARYDP
jgi:hypothetical protein